MKVAGSALGGFLGAWVYVCLTALPDAKRHKELKPALRYVVH